MEMQAVFNRYETIPFSYFLLDRNLDILSVSKHTLKQFYEVEHFLDLIDIGSQRKARKFLLETPSLYKIELNLRTKSNPYSLFDVYTQYEQDHIHLFCINKDDDLREIQNVMRTLELDLMNSNMLLVEKKAELEKALQEIREAAIKNDNLATVGKLAASIAHEIRNPLTTVKGFIQLLKPHLVAIGKEEYADIAIDEINRANDIIYEFLNASKPSPPIKQTISLSKIINDIVLLYEGEATMNNCVLSYKATKHDVLINIDVKQVKQVLLNVIKNAIDAILESSNKQNGQVFLYTFQCDRYIEIYIQDNGKGMDEKVIQKLFMPFFTTKEKGTGIGLSVCHKIIEAHDGKIEVESHVGKGSIFKITLPL
ncbi:ATP-binding protein [Metabacillus iocasae]|uniref:histidine kinase n=1 Tax=Priestia iocasae TaxID=2291674 RepID=A0ABS2QSC7_9BACI|nr:ATP-binding protein [Metabacillus iocasae]MBM7702123.1 signal transduction histidine kinase [Metabacillus iocasae]